MNNDQFRKLVSDTPRVDRSQNGGATKNSTSGAPALGSRQRGFMPMTPRSIGGNNNNSNDFARQVAAHRAAQNGTQQQNKSRKFRSAAPLGSKLPEGYIDRAKAIRDAEKAAAAASESGGGGVDGEDVMAAPIRPAPKDENEKRLFAIMDLVREGKMDKDTAIEQTKLLGGDVSSTHLVKGLDFALLNRARRGEDLLGSVVIGKEGIGTEGDKGDGKFGEEGAVMDVDDELDMALEKEVVVTTREKKEEERDREDDDVVVPRKKTRAEILEELKKSRAAVASAITAPVLGSRFKKISEKVSKTKKSSKQNGNLGAQHVDKKLKTSGLVERTDVDITKPVMGMQPPDLPASVQKNTANDEDEDEDIFADAGAEYDPLAGIISDDDDDNDHEDKKDHDMTVKDTFTSVPTNASSPPPPPSSASACSSAPTSMLPPPTPVTTTPSTSTTATAQPRNYFSTPSTSLPTSSSSSTPINPLDNSDLLAAIKKASLLSAAEAAANQQQQQQQPSAKHQAMLSASRRDDADVDMGFGGSRTFGDDDDDEGPVEDEHGGGGGGKSKKRKRKKNKA